MQTVALAECPTPLAAAPDFTHSGCGLSRYQAAVRRVVGFLEQVLATHPGGPLRAAAAHPDDRIKDIASIPLQDAGWAEEQASECTNRSRLARYL